MTREQIDILVVGGGIAGLVAAAAMGRAGYRTVLVDPTPPVTDGAAQGADLRSTAFLRPARDLFAHIGIWTALRPHATPLEALRVVDTSGDPVTVRAERTFRGAEMGDEPFGWNFLNWVIRRELLAIIPTIPDVELRYGTGFKSLVNRTAGAIVTLSDGSQVQAKLVIGADGRDSPLRDAAGIGVHTTRYGQKSLAFTATHALPHRFISTEIYRTGGPFTMVPLPDVGGQPASAIVWMNSGPRAEALRAMDDDAFNAEMTERSAGLFGPMQIASPKGIFPIISQHAHHLTEGRIALIAEAAHVLPPIGAQGLNTSLNDISELLTRIETAPADPGAAATLQAYERKRLPDITARARAIDLFNRVTRGSGDLSQMLRLSGLTLAHDITPVRRGLMRAGMAPL